MMLTFMKKLINSNNKNNDQTSNLNKMSTNDKTFSEHSNVNCDEPSSDYSCDDNEFYCYPVIDNNGQSNSKYSKIKNDKQKSRKHSAVNLSTSAKHFECCSSINNIQCCSCVVAETININNNINGNTVDVNVDNKSELIKTSSTKSHNNYNTFPNNDDNNISASNTQHHNNINIYYAGHNSNNMHDINKDSSPDTPRLFNSNCPLNPPSPNFDSTILEASSKTFSSTPDRKSLPHRKLSNPVPITTMVTMTRTSMTTTKSDVCCCMDCTHYRNKRDKLMMTVKKHDDNLLQFKGDVKPPDVFVWPINASSTTSTTTSTSTNRSICITSTTATKTATSSKWNNYKFDNVLTSVFKSGNVKEDVINICDFYYINEKEKLISSIECNNSNDNFLFNDNLINEDFNDDDDGGSENYEVQASISSSQTRGHLNATVLHETSVNDAIFKQNQSHNLHYQQQQNPQHQQQKQQHNQHQQHHQLADTHQITTSVPKCLPQHATKPEITNIKTLANSMQQQFQQQNQQKTTFATVVTTTATTTTTANKRPTTFPMPVFRFRDGEESYESYKNMLHHLNKHHNCYHSNTNSVIPNVTIQHVQGLLTD